MEGMWPRLDDLDDADGTRLVYSKGKQQMMKRVGVDGRRDQAELSRVRMETLIASPSESSTLRF